MVRLEDGRIVVGEIIKPTTTEEKTVEKVEKPVDKPKKAKKK